MNKTTKFSRTLLSSAILIASFQASAEDANYLLSSDTLFTGLINETSFMKETGFEVGLWASAGITGNTNGGTNPPGFYVR